MPRAVDSPGLIARLSGTGKNVPRVATTAG